MANSRIVRTNDNGELDIDLSETVVAKFFRDLEIVDRNFHSKDKKTLRKIKLAVANPEARKIIGLYRAKIKERSLAAKMTSTVSA
jgi:hypothetical protein